MLKNQNLYDTEFTKERIPDFYTPTRTRLLFQILQDMRNDTRIQRKPMPKKVKKEFVQKSKEYHEYKVYERMYIAEEKMRKK